MSDVHSVFPVSIRWERDHFGLGSSVDGLPDLPVSAPEATIEVAAAAEASTT